MAAQVKSMAGTGTQVGSAFEVTTGSVKSKDGTVVAYKQLGQGPAVVVLHGAMESARSHLGLARTLSEHFTVYLVERRGHNLPGPFHQDYSMQQEVEDLAALLEKTGGHCVFGVSAGGLIALQAALTLPELVRKVAVFEPALIVNGSASTDFLPRLDREIAEGDIAAALVSGMLGGQLGPSFFKYIPRPLLEWMTEQGVKKEDKTAGPDDITLRRLAPTLHYDFILAGEMAEKAATFSRIGGDVLLLGGSDSPAWLKLALDELQKVMPKAQRIEFPGLNHSGSSDASAVSPGGDPALVGRAALGFFGEG